MITIWQMAVNTSVAHWPLKIQSPKPVPNEFWGVNYTQSPNPVKSVRLNVETCPDTPYCKAVPKNYVTKRDFQMCRLLTGGKIAPVVSFKEIPFLFKEMHFLTKEIYFSLYKKSKSWKKEMLTTVTIMYRELWQKFFPDRRLFNLAQLNCDIHTKCLLFN